MSLLPPPPAPPVITLDDDDDNGGGRKEDGELSDDDGNSKSSNDKDAPADAAAGAKSRKKRSKKKKAKKAAGAGTTAADGDIIPDTPAEGSDIEVVGNNLFEIDDDGADIDDGLDMAMDDINDEEVFKKIQRAAGINADDIDISINIAETPKATRNEGTCFNCRGPHALNECTLPLDKRIIARNRQSFGSTRKDRITERTESKFAPGKLTEEALKALNLYDDEYPQWIYGMRDMGPFQGYPPAYLKRLKPSDKRLSFYCDDPHLTTEVAKAELEFDPEKIIYYDGFNLIDRNSPAERRCNQGIRKELRYKVWTKTNYPGEFERFLKDSINKDRAAESRKRQHDNNDNDYSQQQQYNQSKRDKNNKKKAKQREKQAAAKEIKAVERKAEDDKRNWQQYQHDKAKEKLISDYNATNFEEEPQKIHMVNETFGIFATKQQRKQMDREKSRSARSLEEEANWNNRMREEERAAAKAKTERERLAKEEKAAKKAPPKTWQEKQAERIAKKKAEKEERQRQRLEIERKLVDAETQTDRVRILPWIAEENEEVVPERPRSVLSVLFPNLSFDAKEESRDKDVPLRPTVADILRPYVTTPVPESEDPQGDKIPIPYEDFIDRSSSPEIEKQSGEAVTTESSKLNDVEVIDIVTVKQQEQEKLLKANVTFHNASSSFQSAAAQKPSAKHQRYDSYLSCSPSPPLIGPRSGSTNDAKKKPLVNPPVSKQELENFKKNKSNNQSSSAKGAVAATSYSSTNDHKQAHDSSSKSSMPSKNSKGNQYSSDPSLPTSKRSRRRSKKAALEEKHQQAIANLSAAAKEEKQLINPPVAKEELKYFKTSRQPSKDSQPQGKQPQQQQMRAGGNATQLGQHSLKKQEAAQPPKNSQGNRQVNSNARTFFRAAKSNSQEERHHQPPSNNKQYNNKKKGQRNDPPMNPEDYYGAPITSAEAHILSRMPITDAKPKVSAPRKQSDREKYKNDPKIPTSSSKKSDNKGRYDNDANSVGPSSSTSRGNQNRPNAHIVFKDTDTPASPELPPVVSRVMTEDQAAPKAFLVAEVDDRKMPNTDNFAKDITPFQYDNLQERRGTLDILEKLIQSVKKD